MLSRLLATAVAARRRARVLIAGTLMAVSLIHGVAAQQPETMKVNGDRVNMRVAPTIDSAIVRSVAGGTLVTVISRDGGWTKVQLKGQTTIGWIRSNLLAAVATAGAASPAPQQASQAPPAAAPPTGSPKPQRVAPPPAPAAPAPSRAPDPVAGYKDPGTATLISVVVPGGGQLYAGDTGRGFMLLGGALGAPILGCGVARSLTPCELGFVASVGIWIYGIVDAAPTARRMNATNGVRVGLLPVMLPGSQSRFGVAVNVRF